MQKWISFAWLLFFWSSVSFRLLENGPPGLFIFDLFKQTSLQLLQQIYVKNVHPVYGARIRTTTFRTWVSFITTRPISFRFMSPNKFIHFKYPKKSSTRVLVYLFRPLFVYFVLFTFQLHWWTYNFNYKNEKSVDGIRTLDRIINIPMRWQFHWAEAANQMSRFFNPEIKLQICRLVFAFSCLAYCTTSQYSVKAVVGNKQFNIFAPIWGCFLEKRRNKKESDNWIWHVFPTARFSNAKIFSLFYCGKSSTSHREGVKKFANFTFSRSLNWAELAGYRNLLKKTQISQFKIHQNLKFR